MDNFWNEVNETGYWCQLCDRNLVYPMSPETGRFYTVFGVSANDGGYHGVRLAICSQCNPMDYFKPIDLNGEM